MPLTRSRATIWTCSDGERFEDFARAAEHEHELAISSYLRELLSHVHIEVNGHDYVNLEQAVTLLLSRREELGKLFTKSRVAYRRESSPSPVTFEGTLK